MLKLMVILIAGLMLAGCAARYGATASGVVDAEVNATIDTIRKLNASETKALVASVGAIHAGSLYRDLGPNTRRSVACIIMGEESTFCQPTVFEFLASLPPEVLAALAKNEASR